MGVCGEAISVYLLYRPELFTGDIQIRFGVFAQLFGVVLA